MIICFVCMLSGCRWEDEMKNINGSITKDDGYVWFCARTNRLFIQDRLDYVLHDIIMKDEYCFYIGIM